MDKPQITGLHHMTAIASDAQQNVDFYTAVLGLRLVKLTVNFDDPSAYHLYYGDGIGTPGSILTFFPYGGGYKGRAGAGAVTKTSLLIPPDAMGWWAVRLSGLGIDTDGPRMVGDEMRLAFEDPDGILLELVGIESDRKPVTWEGTAVPFDKAIVGMHAVTLTQWELEPTQAVLSRMGYRVVDETSGISRFEVGAGGSGTFIDVDVSPNAV